MSWVSKQVARVLRRVVLPMVPSRRKLPFLYRLSMLDGSMEPELQNLHRVAGNGAVAIDVGTNVGLYSYRLSKLFPKVYSFELNGDLTDELVAFNPGNIEIINKGLSSTNGSATLYVPVLNGFPLVGWASLAPNNCPDTNIHIEKPVQICTLDSFGIEAVSFIKIDVEGHEMEVLRGASQTLARDRPTVLVEVKQGNMEGVLGFFASLDYQQKRLADLIGVTGLAENLIFVPSEKL